MSNRGRPRVITASQLQTIQELAKTRKSYWLIAKELNLNHGMVKYWLDRYSEKGHVNNQSEVFP